MSTMALSAQELDMVAAIVSGCSNREIARKLSISEDKVKRRLTIIYRKVGAHNRLELALIAISNGMLGKRAS